MKASEALTLSRKNKKEVTLEELIDNIKITAGNGEVSTSMRIPDDKYISDKTLSTLKEWGYSLGTSKGVNYTYVNIIW